MHGKALVRPLEEVGERAECLTARPSWGTGCSSRSFLTRKSHSTPPGSAPAKVLSLCPQGLGTAGQRRQSLCPLHAEARMSARLGVMSPLTSGFSPSFPEAVSLETLVHGLPRALTPQSLLLSPQHLSLVWPLQSLTYTQLSLECHSQFLRLPGVGTETLIVPQPPPPPPHWPSPPCGQPGPAGITQLPSLPRALDYLQLTKAFTPMSSLEPPPPTLGTQQGRRHCPHFADGDAEVKCLAQRIPLSLAWPPDSSLRLFSVPPGGGPNRQVEW